MDGHVIIDRRLNPKDRNLSNRRRFVDRIREQVRESARKKLTGKGLRDKNDTKVSVPIDGIAEPRFQHDRNSGEHDYILPGNQSFSPGDRLRKPRQQGGGGGSQGGDGDDFEFALSHDEYIEIVFNDLDLPDMVKRSEKAPTSMEFRRAGFSVSGSPSTLDIERTLGQSLARRIALRAPKLTKIRELEEEAARLEAEGGHEARIAEIVEEIARLRIGAAAVQFLDPVDLRYRRFEPKPRPGPRAVMFCLMDVSGSMGDRERTIAKRFFMLLSLFLQKRYSDLDIVFIRHHHNAEEVDEETFFGTGATGGTVVSMAYKKAEEVLAQRYPVADWNIYFAQASDGDNMDSDEADVQTCMTRLLALSQYYAYIEIGRDPTGSFFHHDGGNVTTLWQSLAGLREKNRNLSMRQVNDDDEVVGVFRSLFDGSAEKAHS